MSHPAKQGLIQAFSIYIDTLVVCTASGLMILVTNMYNVFPDGGATALIEHVPGVAAGTAWTQMAVSTVFESTGSGFVSIAVFLFAFTTLMAYYYIAETTIVYLDRQLKYPILKLVLKMVFLLILFMGSVQSVSMMWSLGDIGFGSMSYLNLIAIVFLSKPALRALRDYERQEKLGIDPVFDPKVAGVENAQLWEEISREYQSQTQSPQHKQIGKLTEEQE
ncbi:Na+/alanine symporter [Providencia stuartii]|nr:Na+/alanine symporter [Providencia stuartii]